MALLDTTNPFHQRVAERLTTEEVAWLVTLDANGTPQPSPIWFLWDGDSQLLIYSEETPKVRNIKAHSRVAFHLNGDAYGGDIVVLTGSAAIDENQPKGIENIPYGAKYMEAIGRLGADPAGFSAQYHVPIVVTLEKVRGH